MTPHRRGQAPVSPTSATHPVRRAPPLGMKQHRRRSSTARKVRASLVLSDRVRALADDPAGPASVCRPSSPVAGPTGVRWLRPDLPELSRRTLKHQFRSIDLGDLGIPPSLDAAPQVPPSFGSRTWWARVQSRLPRAWASRSFSAPSLDPWIGFWVPGAGWGVGSCWGWAGCAAGLPSSFTGVSGRACGGRWVKGLRGVAGGSWPNTPRQMVKPLRGPGPVFGEVEHAPALRAGDAGGDVDDAAAQGCSRGRRRGCCRRGVAAARSRLWVIAAQMAQAWLAANRPEGRWARGPSMRSAKTVSMIACRRWVRSASARGGRCWSGTGGGATPGTVHRAWPGRGLGARPVARSAGCRWWRTR